MSPTRPPDDGAALSIVRVPPGRREAYQPLLELADDSPTEIARYRDRGELFGLLDTRGAPCGLVLAEADDAPDTVCLTSVALAEEHQGQGLGRRLVQQVLARLRDQGYRRVTVSTASASVDALAFYQKLGFRLLRIERDWFRPERGYSAGLMEDGIPVRDRVWLDRSL